MKKIKSAGFGKRFVAFVIDFVLIVILCGLIISVLIYLGFFSFIESWKADGKLTLSEVLALLMTGMGLLGFVMFSLVVPFVYEAVMLASAKQATVGKLVVGIKVTKETGGKLSGEEAIIRSFLKFVSMNLCFLLFLACLFNPEQQNLHDLAARTFVVEDQSKNGK